MCFSVAMFSLHTSPIASLGRTRDAGGMNVYVRGLARELGRSGIDVDIFTRRTSPETPQILHLSERVRLVTLPAGPEAPLPPSALFPYVGEFSRRVAHFATQHGRHYDLLHSHYWLSAAAALPLAARWDVPHVTMFHTVERLKALQYAETVTETPASAIRIEQERRIVGAVDAIVVSTTHEREQLRRLYGLPSSRLHIVPCGTALSAFPPARPSERPRFRRALGLPEAPTLLFVGRLDPIKGLDLLLESVATMRQPARLVLVGGNPEGDAELERLRQRAADLGIADRVDLPGAVPQETLPAYYRAADALVVTSRYESFGLVAVEALASGTPVVAAAVGGLPSLVRDGENGLLVHTRSAAAFAERLDLLLAQPALANRLAANARASVAHLDWPRIGDAVRSLYQ